jgi:exopolyphosphatase/guanosine-5'-triphosphate,3'-diphosphate pyrophosphatase
MTDKDMREHSVQQFLHRYHVDQGQVARVAQLVQALFDRLMPENNLERTELARHLVMAARLHEVGISISHSGYRRHSAYIIQNADIPGFSRREQDLMSRLVLAHRGRLTKVNLNDFSREERGALACLRLAVLFCRARQDNLPAIIDFRRNGQEYTLQLEQGWLEAHPLTSHVVAEEIRLWQEVGITLRVIPAPAA